MTDQGHSEIDQLWTKYSKVDLWKQVSEWWESASRARVVMLLALHHTDDLSLPEIVQKAGAPEAMVLEVLRDLEKQRVVECHGGISPKYRIADEQEFLKLMQECCHRTSAAADVLSTLAGWASRTEES
jgi:hypothetical protein